MIIIDIFVDFYLLSKMGKRSSSDKKNVPIVITLFGEISKKIKREVTWAFEEASFEIEVLSFDRKMS